MFCANLTGLQDTQMPGYTSLDVPVKVFPEEVCIWTGELSETDKPSHVSGPPPVPWGSEQKDWGRRNSIFAWLNWNMISWMGSCECSGLQTLGPMPSALGLSRSSTDTTSLPGAPAFRDYILGLCNYMSQFLLINLILDRWISPNDCFLWITRILVYYSSHSNSWVEMELRQ